MALATFASTGGGTYFKPADYGVGTVFVIDTLHFARQVPGDFGPKDVATADIHVMGDDGFDTFESVKINQTYLSKDLEPFVGQTIAVTLEQTDPKPGKKPAWVWRQVSDKSVLAAVTAFVEGKGEIDGPPGM